MKKIAVVISLSAIALASCSKKSGNIMAEGFETITNQEDSVSYFIGMDIAQNFKTNKIDRLFSPSSFNKGLKDGFSGAELMLSKEEGNSLIMANLNEIRNDSSEFIFTPSSINEFSALASMQDSISYFLGTDIAGGLTGNGFNKYFSEASFYKGLEDGFMGNAELISKEEGEKVAMKIMESEKENIMAAQKEQFAGKIAEGEAFLAEKTAQEEVVTLPSGLRYKILKEGNGPKPAATDVVSTHYHGTLIDGTVFDSSVDRGEPTEFPVNRVIPGWTEALQLMPVGSKWELYIPYNLAYGEQGAGGSIEPYSTLIFEVELLEIKKEQE